MKIITIFISLVALLTSCQLLPASQPMVTPTSITPAVPIQPVNKYHDPILGFSLEYPKTWKEVGIGRLKGDDGYLTISELPNYHSLSADHVCSDYAYMKLKGENTTFVHFGAVPGCMILQTPADKIKHGDKMLGILRQYNTHEREYDYFLLEGTYPRFIDISSSLVFDKTSSTPSSLSSTASQPFQLDMNDLHIGESFAKAASFDGEHWNIDNLYINDKNRDSRQYNHCGKSITVNGHMLTADDVDAGTDLVEVKRGETTIFSLPILSGPSSGVWAFCEWNGSWFLETSDFIIQDGQILNHKLGYDDMFGWHILAGKQFYFFTKNGTVYTSYNGQVLPIKYDFVPHYGCCEAGSLRNPNGNDNEVWFFGAHDGAWYFVEVKAK